MLIIGCLNCCFVFVDCVCYYFNSSCFDLILLVMSAPCGFVGWVLLGLLQLMLFTGVDYVGFIVFACFTVVLLYLLGC